MTTPTFTPPRNPDVGLSRNPVSSLLETGFGDGYTQAAADGLNNVRDVVTLKWSGLSQSEVDALFAFYLAQQGGALPFFYQLPGATSPTKWTWKEYSQGWATSGANVTYTLQATFRQNFNP